MVDGNAILWAKREFCNAQLGDSRRKYRVMRIAAGSASNAGVAISQCCGAGDAQSVSRVLARPEVTLKSVMESHIQQTAQRCQKVERVLAVQDTTYLDFTSHKALKGTGPINTGKNSRGLMMHNVLACDINRVPIGLLGIDIWARSEEEHGKSNRRGKLPIEKKESKKWLRGLLRAQAAIPAGKPMTVIGDRESDIFELFIAPRRDSVDLLVRATHNRAVDDPECQLLWEAIDGHDENGRYVLKVPRSKNQAAREAEMSVKFFEVTLKAPQNRKAVTKSVTINCVCTREINPPAGADPLDWVLLTTMPVETLDDALYVIDAYTCRWVIEEFHKVLKSGCNVEGLQLESLDSMLPAIVVLSVVAWRVLYITKFARESPDTKASEFCSTLECNVLSAWMKVRRKRTAPLVTVRDFVRSVGILGGFMARKNDGEPGVKSVWTGLRRLEDLVDGYTLVDAMK